jgi:hypothetical protein
MRILTAHQPAYLAWLGYFHKIAISHEFILLDAVQFEKNSFTNRNRIKTSNGVAWLTIPVEMKGHINRNVNEMLIDERSEWRKKHWNSLLLNYKKAPFFGLYSDFFESYYKNTLTSNLSEFIKISTSFILKELGIETICKELSSMQVHSSKQDLIIDLCKATGSDLFVFGSQGRQYVNEDNFKSRDIYCYFQEYHHPVYQQLWGEFAPHLSVLDALFNLGAQSTKEIIFEGNISRPELLKLT